MKRRSLAWIGLLLIGLCLVGGCSKRENEEGAKAEVFDKEVLKLNFVLGEMPSLDPRDLALGARGIAAGKWLFEGLTRLNLEGKYELAGAESLTISPCQTRYTFTLRRNFYSDGTAVIAPDYERCWKECLALDSKCLKAHLFYYIKNAKEAKKGEVSLDEVGVKALDDQTLVVELKHPAPHFLGLLSSSVFAPFKVKENEILFNGPYRIAESKKNDYLILEASPFFWDEAHTAIKRIKIFMIQDGMTALSLYEQRGIDWMGDPFSWLASDIVASERAKGNFFKGADVLLPYWFYLNTDHPHLASALIRRALGYVIDREAIAEHLFTGDEPLFSPLPGDFGQVTIDLNLAKGKELFEKGLEEMGLTRETFPILKVSACNLTADKRLAEYLQERWQEALGIRVEVDFQEWHTFYSNLAKGNYQLGGYFTPSDYNDPTACLELLSSENNFPRWQHARYREVVERLKREGEGRVRDQLLREAEEILVEEMPIIWLLNRAQYHGYRSDLKGVCFDQRGIPDFRWAYFEEASP